MGKKDKKVGYIVSHTHWDREWRYTIWKTRIWLVDFMDELIDVLKTGKYKAFLMDGQVVPLIDYLEIRPEKENILKELVKNDQLQIGPWYCLPDEYPVDGEALVRNLLKGHRIAKNFGRVCNIGYTSFGWGQTAQLPQIYKGFGIDTAFIGKRVNKKRAPDSEFIWQAPDGSQLLTSRFGDKGRQNFYFCVHLLALYGLDHETWDWKYKPGQHGQLFHRTEKEHMEQDHFRIDAPQKLHLDKITSKISNQTWETTSDSVIKNHRLMMNGCDYAASQPQLPKIIDKLQEVDQDANRIWKQASLPEFVEIMKDKIDRNKLKKVYGELRDGPSSLNTGNALATRLYIKQLNKKAQNLLIKTAEPFAAIASLNGAEHPEILLEKAWNYLLNSHPHDSINAVTQDKTARDVEHRLEQVIDLANSITEKSIQELMKNIDSHQFNEDDLLLFVFNPLPYPREEIITTYVTHDKDRKFNSEWIDDLGFLQVYDTDNNPLDTQWEGVEEIDYNVSEFHARSLPYYTKRHKIIFNTGNLPPLGYKVYRIAQDDEVRPKQTEWSDQMARTSSILKSPNILENENLRVEVNPNGTFDLLNLHTGKKYEQLNYYEDRGEHGTYWINWRPMRQKTYNTTGCQAQIWSEEEGPLQATIVTEVNLDIPVHSRKDRQARGPDTDSEELKIRTYITLKKNSNKVDIKVKFNNQHEDHYLRAMFPTGLENAEEANSGGHFYIDKRPISAQGPDKRSQWPDMATLPMNNFLDLSDKDNGLAFLSNSLTEYEVLEDAKRTVALSLLRAVKNWIVTGHVGSDFPSQKGGQCKGEHSIEYSIRPHQGNWQDADIPLEAEFVNIPPVSVQSNNNQGVLPSDNFFLKIENSNLYFSALKKAADRDNFILRVYNTTGTDQTSVIKTYNKIAKAWYNDLNENRVEKIDTKSDQFEITAGPHKIVTVELKFSP